MFDNSKNDDLYELPISWIWTVTKDVCSSVKDGTHDTPKYVDEGVPLITSKNLKEYGIDFSNTRNISYQDHNNISIRSGVAKGDILFAMIGTIGNPVIVNTDQVFSIKNVGLFKKNPSFILSNYLKYWLSCSCLQKIIENKGFIKGTTQKFIPLGHLRILPVPLAPLNEQYRIVAKIEELFSELDQGIESLKKAKEQLKIYRQAVLKSAFEGKLTEDWRTQQLKEGKLESAEILLEKIKLEREKYYQQQLEEWQKSVKLWEVNGKEGKKPSKPKKLEEVKPFSNNEIAELSKLPKEWKWVRWDNILAYGDDSFKRGPFGSSLKKSMFVEQGYKVYEQYCPINDDCSFARYFITKEKFEELETFSVKEGDYLISCSGVTLGRITRIPKVYDEGIINQALLRVRINENIIFSDYFLKLFRSPYFQKQIFSNSTGSAIPNVKGVKELKSIHLPLPSINEQLKIVEEIESRFTMCDILETSINESLQKAEALRQSILKQAFEGKLVPQDPNDEPAEKLLEKIKQTTIKIN